MATYFLDPDDEITKAAALIRDAADPEVALVVPPGSRVATSRMNFRLLAREASTRHRRLSIVAPDAASRALAASAGLPVFASVADHEAAAAAPAAGSGNGRGAETAVALEELAATVETPDTRGVRHPEPARRGSGSPKRAELPAEHRGISFASAMLVLLLLAIVVAAGAGAYLFLPSAAIALTPRAEAMSALQLTVRVDPTVAQPDPANLVAPGIAQKFPVQATGNFQATGQKVTDTRASGVVTFKNGNNSSTVVVPSGTQVWTNSGVVFLTHAKVTVPQAGPTGTQDPGVANVAVDAQRAGTSGNVAAGSIVNLPASLNAAANGYLSVTNANATSGGTHTVTPIVQQSDVDAATADLASQLNQQFNAAITDPTQTPAGMQLFPDTAQLGAPAYDPDPATLVGKQVDQANPTFMLVATASGTATAANLDGIRTLAEGRLRQNVPAGRELVEDSISIQFGDATATGAAVNVAVTAAAKTLPSLDLAALKNDVKGKSQAEAKRILSQYGDVDLKMSPDWLPNLPGFDFRIDLRIVQPAPSPSPESASPTGPAAPTSTSTRSTQPSPTQSGGASS